MNRHMRHTVFRLMISLVVIGIMALSAAAAEPVAVTESILTLPWYRSMESQEYDFRFGNFPIYSVAGTERRVGKRDLRAVVLENRYLRITVLPEIGSAIGRVIYKPTGDDIFFQEGRVKDWTPFWESGVKINFPGVHHTVSTSQQPASYRIVRHPDGAVTVAMWMEFSRFNEWYHGPIWGRYTTMLLSHHVTLRPDRSDFEDTTRIVNPAGYPQGRRVWNDALFPRNHTPQGVIQGAAEPPAVTDTEWIYPAYEVSDHRGYNFRRWTEAGAKLHDIRSLHNSVFSWSMPYGFVGLWYPSVKVSRLRLFDPAIAPGAKQYYRGEGSYAQTVKDIPYEHMYNFIELFGGPDHTQEGVENWLDPGESFQYSHRYTMVKGIGKVDFANTEAAVHVELAGDNPRLEVVTLSPVKKLSATCNGKPLARDAMPCQPETPCVVALPPNLTTAEIELKADGHAILKQAFPLPMAVNTSAYASIRAAINMNDLSSTERFQTDRLIAVALEKSGETNTTRVGRVLYRVGRLNEAAACLENIVKSEPDDGEAWYFLGLVRQDLAPSDWGKSHVAFTNAVSAKRPYPAAHYFAALDALHRPEYRVQSEHANAATLNHVDAPGYPAALAHLEKLVALRPNHLEGRLLKAWLQCQMTAKRAEGLAELKQLDAEDPADPRIQLALAECADLAGNDALAAEARRNLRALSAEPGAWRRLAEFDAATRGIYQPPRRQREPDPKVWNGRQ